MKVQFVVVPPGGGEADYQFDKEMDALPNAGDYVFKRDFKEGEPVAWAAIIVRRRWFWPGESEGSIIIEVEPARYAIQSDNHKRTCDMYAARGKPPQQMDESCF